MNRCSIRRALPLIFWLLALIATPIWLHFSSPGWDANVYAQAMRSLKAGHDPYLDGIARQDAFHKALALHPHDPLPFSYVYSPITLPLLLIAGSLPAALLAVEFWLLYAAGALAQLRVTALAAEPNERFWVALAAPAAVYFPGLLFTDVIQSGNIAYIVYGLALATALRGWRRGRWLRFYVVIVAASCFKAPYLSLLAIPVLSARRQWAPAGAASAAGLAQFALQWALWPAEFHRFLHAVSLQFAYNHDFGLSPAGQLGAALAAANLLYEHAVWAFYLCYAIPVFAVLLVLSRRYLSGAFSINQWMPVLLTGVILLDPRNIEYDVAPLTLPMALILVRLLAPLGARLRVILPGLLLFGFANWAVFGNRDHWRLGECLLVAICFAGGSLKLLRQTRTAAQQPAANLYPAPSYP